MNLLANRFLRYLPCLLLTLSLTLPANQVQAESAMEKMGDAFQFVVPAYAFGLTMREETHEGMKQFAYSLIASQAMVHILKKVTNEKRPNYKEGDTKNSFPSGHTSSAFAGATFIHKRYGFKQAIIPYGAAILTGVSRVQAKKHHVRDVLAGAAISAFWTMCFVHRKDNLVLSADEDGAKLAYEVTF